MAGKSKQPKSVESLKHDAATRKNIPTAEYQSVMREEEQHPVRVAYERRNRDLDPQLVWRGKDEQDWSDLVVQAPPLYIQEKVHPKVLIDDLLKQSEAREPAAAQMDLFADFNGLPDEGAKTEFYLHDANWTNRMILGDSLQVMASLAEREGLRGQVQCIYIDPPYGIKFNSNFQWSTTSRDVKDGKADHITREPEQVKAFRDTWRDGIHSYLTYLRDRLTVARDLLTESGSIFVQIGDENVHRIRTMMDEVFGAENFVAQISFRKKLMPLGAKTLESMADHLVWYSKNLLNIKYRQLYIETDPDPSGRWTGVEDNKGELRRLQKDERRDFKNIPEDAAIFGTVSQWAPSFSQTSVYPFSFQGNTYFPTRGRCWVTVEEKMIRLSKARRLYVEGAFPRFISFHKDFCYKKLTNPWQDTAPAQDKSYVVETNQGVVQRCILMTTDPGDLVLDPTCGSGTTAYVAEQWGRRWITIDTSRVALALARARIMGARYPYYHLADSRDGQLKEAEITRSVPSEAPTFGNIRRGFVYERVPHITLKSIANNAEIDVIWEKYQEKLEPLREKLNAALSQNWAEWEIPRDAENDWPAGARQLHAEWWEHRISRQREIDASIAAKADYEYLYDKPYEDNKKVRVAGPFTVESLSPHRVLGVDENDELIDPADAPGRSDDEMDFVSMILENLKMAGVQQAHKADKIDFTSLTPWPGHFICAEGRYVEGEADNGAEKRAGIFIGPEFGTITRPDLVAAAREAGDANFDVLISCGFNYDAHSTDFDRLGRIPVLRARMNADLHMAEDLKNTGKGNLFVIFGEPDVAVVSEEWLVDSSEQRIAPYEIFKLISGVDSLAEINRLSREDLQDYAQLSSRGEIWNDIANATLRDLRSGKYSGGTSPQEHRRISAIAGHCEGFAGGIGNVSDFIRTFGFSGKDEFRAFVERLRRDKQNAKRSDQITLHSPLTTRHFVQVTLNGVDVFHPSTGEVRSDSADGIACWFIDTDYNEESFFVRQAYFLGANDPYKSLKTTLKAEIDEEAWETLYSDVSRPFAKPATGRIAVKVINHLGDEVMKVFRVN